MKNMISKEITAVPSEKIPERQFLCLEKVKFFQKKFYCNSMQCIVL